MAMPDCPVETGASSNNLNFAYELARQKQLVITRSNGEKMVVDLTGSSDAIDAMIVCQVATMK